MAIIDVGTSYGEQKSEKIQLETSITSIIFPLKLVPNISSKMSEKRIIRRRRAGSTGSDSEDEVVLSGASQEDGVSCSEFILFPVKIYLLPSIRKILFFGGK